MSVQKPTSRLGRDDTLAGRAVAVQRHVLSRDTPPHGHDFAEVVIIAGGAGQHRTLHGVAPLARGDALVLPAGGWHAYERCRSLVVWNCCFGFDLLHRELGWAETDPLLCRAVGLLAVVAGRDARATARGRLGPAALRRAVGLLETMAGERSKPRLVAGLLLVLAEVAATLPPTPVPSDPPHPAVVRATRLLRADVRRDWTAEALARAVGLDADYLARLFRRHVGLPPMRLLARLRAERAASLLVTTALPINDVGRLVGWDDPTRFARAFRRHHGCPASDFRFRHRGRIGYTSPA